MNKYIISARSPNDSIRKILNNKEEEDYFCTRTLEWSINPIIEDGIFDEIIISYDGKLCKEIIDKLSEKSKTPIITIPTSRYFTRTVDDVLFGNDPENLDGVDLKSFVNNNDKIFVAHMDAFYDQNIYQTMINFDRPLVFGTHNYTIFQVGRNYYKWIADNMALGSVEFLRDKNVRFSWNTFTETKKENFYKLANMQDIWISGTHLSQVKSLDGLHEGSLRLAILQYLEQINPTDLVDIGDSNIITKDGTHFKAFFNPDPKSGQRFIVNNAIIQAVIFGRVYEQAHSINQIEPQTRLSVKLKLSDYERSYFGQKILNHQEKDNFNLLIESLS